MDTSRLRWPLWCLVALRRHRQRVGACCVVCVREDESKHWQLYGRNRLCYATSNSIGINAIVSSYISFEKYIDGPYMLIYHPALRVTYWNVISHVLLVLMGDLSPVLYLKCRLSYMHTCCHWLHQFVFVLTGRKRLVEGTEMDAKWTLSLLAAILHTGTYLLQHQCLDTFSKSAVYSKWSDTVTQN